MSKLLDNQEAARVTERYFQIQPLRKSIWDILGEAGLKDAVRDVALEKIVDAIIDSDVEIKK